MIYLVLQGAGEQAIGLNLKHSAIELRQRGFHHTGPAHVGLDITDTQASL